MFPSAHKKLALFISEKFSFSEELKNSLIEGSLDPDRKPIWSGYSPHHFGREKDIEKYIYKARREFLRAKPEKTCYFLGYALHFIGDAPIYSPSIYPRYKRGRGAGLKTWHAKRKAKKLHQIFEKEISQLNFIEEIPFFILETPLKIPSTIRNFLYKDTFYSPQSTLNRIYQVSFAFTEITLRDPQKLNQKERELIEKIPKLKIKWLIGISFLIIISFFFFVLLAKISLIFLFLALWLALEIFPSIYKRFSTQFPNPWKLEGWYRKKISFFGLSRE